MGESLPTREELSEDLTAWRLHKLESGADRIEGKVDKLREDFESDRLGQARKSTWTLIGMLATCAFTIVTLLVELTKARATP